MSGAKRLLWRVDDHVLVTTFEVDDQPAEPLTRHSRPRPAVRLFSGYSWVWHFSPAKWILIHEEQAGFN